MATVYLAYSTAGVDTLKRHSEDAPVDMLVAYPLLEHFEKHRKYFNIRKWILDSGAFSVWNSGKTIDLNEYIRVCRDVDACEVIALDDILSWQISQKNAATMFAAGIQALPVYHYREPVKYLEWCVKHSEKIGLGSMTKTRPQWLKWVFSKIWPHKVHGFGMAGWKAVEAVPFDSVDASSWATAAARFGQFAGFTGKQIHLKSRMRASGPTDLWCEVIEHKRRATWSEGRWKKELAKLKDRNETKYA